MFCGLCGEFGWGFICRECRSVLANERPIYRRIDDLNIISLFSYSLTKGAIAQKHSIRGWWLLRALALCAKDLLPRLDAPLLCCENLYFDNYSHNLLIRRILAPRQKDIGRLFDTSQIVYKGRSRAWREAHPRKFIYSPPKRAATPQKVILFDDLITTGLTLRHAAKTLRRAKIQCDLALCLADARF